MAGERWATEVDRYRDEGMKTGPGLDTFRALGQSATTYGDVKCVATGTVSNDSRLKESTVLVGHQPSQSDETKGRFLGKNGEL